jgi:hypothetical protein
MKVEFPGDNFGIDLKPSVYEVDGDEEIIQAYAEHAAACDIGPDTTARAGHLNPSHADRVGYDPGNPAFSFTRNRHRELIFQGPETLLKMVTELFDRIAEAATIPKTKWKSYVQSRVDADDMEWMTLIGSRSSGSWAPKKWPKTVTTQASSTNQPVESEPIAITPSGDEQV